MSATLDKDGREVLDESPVEYPVHFRGSSSSVPLHTRIRNIILQQMAEDNEGVETFEDADDFEVEDDPIDYTTPYEEHFDHMETQSAPTREELQARLKELQAALAAKEEETKQVDASPPAQAQEATAK